MAFNGRLIDNGTREHNGVLGTNVAPTTITVGDVATLTTEALDATASESASTTINVGDTATITFEALDPTITVGYPQTINVGDYASLQTQAVKPRLLLDGTSDLYASITPTTRDYSNIKAQLKSIVHGTANLGTGILGVPSVNLPASLRITQPVNIPAYVRAAGPGQEDLAAALTQVGFHTGLPTLIRSLSTTHKDLGATVAAKYPVDLPSFIMGFAYSDISAELITQRIKNLAAIIWPTVTAAVKNLSAYIRQFEAGVKDLGVTPFKAVVSTHTSDKTPNLRKVAKTFYNNKYLFGTHLKGIVAFNIEPIFGIFPDLHAEIFAQQYFREHIAAFIKGYIFSTKEMPVFARAVSPHVKVTKITLVPHPLKEISAYLNQIGGYKPLNAIIRTSRKGVTGTADDAAFTTTASSYKFILGTGKGLFIPQQNVPTIRTTLFRNNHPTPDLRATAHGWAYNDFFASIKDYPYTYIGASLDPVGLGNIRDIVGRLVPMYPTDMAASISSSGAYKEMLASIDPDGVIVSLAASINPFINPLSYNAIAVSTKPFRDFGALINYSSTVSCAHKSMLVNMPSFIRVFVGGQDDNTIDMGASLNALRLSKGMAAEVTGRKRTRIRTLVVSFRANTRDTDQMTGIAVPVAPSYINMLASIAGLSHEFQLGASIVPVRYSLRNVLYTANETAVDLNNPTVSKEILLSFRSKVSSYVYEDVSDAVYATGDGKWAIDLRSVKRQSNFFDRDPNSRERVIDGVLEFYSVDEAIRNAISIICDRVRDDMGASLIARGSIVGLPVSLGIVSRDKFSDFNTKIISVANSPDISAIINTGPGSSGYKSLPVLISAGGVEISSSIGAQIDGQTANEIGAQITAV